MTAQRRGEKTRIRILKAAEECFALYGYDATGVAEICRRAGVTKGGFYHHFSGKQALFLELLERWLATLDRQLEAARDEAATVPEGLLRMAEMAVQLFAGASGQLPMFLEFWSKAARDPEIWQATIAPYRRYRDFFARLIEAGIAEGTLRPVDPELAAHLIVSVAVGLVLQGVLDPHGADWEQVTQDSIGLLLENLTRKEQDIQ